MPTRCPSLRRDIDVRPVHKKGRRLIELCDQATGARLILSELGYAVAFLMTGTPLDEIVGRARDALHVDLSARRVAAFAERLASFGLLVGSRAQSAHLGLDEAPMGDDGSATLLDPPGARAAALAIAPPPMPAAPARPGERATTRAMASAAPETLALSPAEAAMVLHDALARGGLRTDQVVPLEQAARKPTAGPGAPHVAHIARTVAPTARRGVGRAMTRPGHASAAGAVARRPAGGPAAEGAIDPQQSVYMTRVRW